MIDFQKIGIDNKHQRLVAGNNNNLLQRLVGNIDFQKIEKDFFFKCFLPGILSVLASLYFTPKEYAGEAWCTVLSTFSTSYEPGAKTKITSF